MIKPNKTELPNRHNERFFIGQQEFIADKLPKRIAEKVTPEQPAKGLKNDCFKRCWIGGFGRRCRGFRPGGVARKAVLAERRCEFYEEVK